MAQLTKITFVMVLIWIGVWVAVVIIVMMTVVVMAAVAAVTAIIVVVDFPCTTVSIAAVMMV